MAPIDEVAAPAEPVVAVLGGGQLGRMLGLAGLPLGVRCRFLDPSADAAARALGALVVGDLGDEKALDAVSAGADVATYEWEGVPAASARVLERRLPVRPGPRALEVAQDREAEKRTFVDLAIDVARFVAVDTPADVERGLGTVGLPAVLKTRRGGYDGKGQVVIRATGDVARAWAAIEGRPAILEEQVRFDRELSIVAGRGLDGSTRCYPLVENVHRDGILHTTLAPAPGVTPALQRAGEEIAVKLLDHLGYVGVLAVELFQVGHRLLANEFAPRVHNSGHWTIEGATTSQFEQHLRAILGYPLGSTSPRGHAMMVNCIGSLPDRAAVLAVDGAHLHDYAKRPRPGRKVGHVTVVAESRAELRRRVTALLAAM